MNLVNANVDVKIAKMDNCDFKYHTINVDYSV